MVSHPRCTYGRCPGTIRAILFMPVLAGNFTGAAPRSLLTRRATLCFVWSLRRTSQAARGGVGPGLGPNPPGVVFSRAPEVRPAFLCFLWYVLDVLPPRFLPFGGRICGCGRANPTTLHCPCFPAGGELRWLTDRLVGFRVRVELV